jgi:hypothetical protein
VVRTNVEEYCISEGWVRVQAGRSMDRKGRPLTIKLNGPVEAWYEDLGESAPSPGLMARVRPRHRPGLPPRFNAARRRR